VGGPQGEGLGTIPVPGLLPHPRKASQDGGVSSIGGPQGEGLGTIPVPGLLGDDWGPAAVLALAGRGVEPLQRDLR
jgi:hypothetical protein